MIHIHMHKYGAHCNINMYLWHLEYADLKQRIAQRSQVSRSKEHPGEKEIRGNTTPKKGRLPAVTKDRTESKSLFWNVGQSTLAI